MPVTMSATPPITAMPDRDGLLGLPPPPDLLFFLDLAAFLPAATLFGSFAIAINTTTHKLVIRIAL
jgi:hypothetical protein